MTVKAGTPDGDSSDSPLTVFFVFLRLGLTSFGGPVAHLGFLPQRVRRPPPMAERGALRRHRGAQPVPAGAGQQQGRHHGRRDARGHPGALAAWLGFTLPSALAMIAFGYGVAAVGDSPTRAGCTA